jgi:hypothetical protein
MRSPARHTHIHTHVLSGPQPPSDDEAEADEGTFDGEHGDEDQQDDCADDLEEELPVPAQAAAVSAESRRYDDRVSIKKSMCVCERGLWWDVEELLYRKRPQM